MKKNLALILLTLSFSLFARADEVDPTGDDNYKTVIVNIKQLDKKILNGIPVEITLYLDDKQASVSTELVSQGSDQQLKLSVPKRSEGVFKLGYSALASYGVHTPRVGAYMGMTILDGTIASGVKEFEVRLKRIDVNHFIITRPDGSQYEAKGQYDLTASWPRPDYIAVYTGYGIDVPVGYKYNVQASARTEDGWDDYTADLDFSGM